MYTTVSPNRGREEIGGYSGIAAMRRGREEEQDQRRGDEEEEVEEEGYSNNSGPSLRRGQMRYHRLHQFSRLPPVPERYVVTFLRTTFTFYLLQAELGEPRALPCAGHCLPHLAHPLPNLPTSSPSPLLAQILPPLPASADQPGALPKEEGRGRGGEEGAGGEEGRHW